MCLKNLRIESGIVGYVDTVHLGKKSPQGLLEIYKKTRKHKLTNILTLSGLRKMEEKGSESVVLYFKLNISGYKSLNFQ